jgi:hypothetical protein
MFSKSTRSNKATGENLWVILQVFEYSENIFKDMLISILKVFELESLASRSEHGTIPPLKLKAKSPPSPQSIKLVSRIEESLDVYQDPAKTEFLKMLGLSPSSNICFHICKCFILNIFFFKDGQTQRNPTPLINNEESSTNSLCINYPSYTSSTRKTRKFVDGMAHGHFENNVD